VLLGHVTEWRKMIENARLKASASSLLPAYPSKQHGPPSMENTSKSGHTHGDTLTRYTSYTYTGTISTVSIGSSTLPYSNFNNIVFQKKNSIILSYGHWPEVSCNLLLVAALGHCCRLQLSLGHSSSQAPCYYCSRGRAQ